MFEKFGSPALFLAKNAVLSAFATAKQTALVVDSGHVGTTGEELQLTVGIVGILQPLQQQVARNCMKPKWQKGILYKDLGSPTSIDHHAAGSAQISSLSMACLRDWIWVFS
jgi:hypothetical protein